MVSQLVLITAPTILLLGGTTEARALANRLAVAGVKALYSYAGRTKSPHALPIPTRIGGFGGADGLADYIRQTGFTHIVDATHPFAAKMSHNAVAAADATGTPLVALVRPPWQPVAGDQWIEVANMARAVAALAIEPQRVFLAIGRTEVAQFAANPDHFYLLRLVDEPSTPPPLPNCKIVTGRGPFTQDADRALLERHEISIIVTKNAGGTGARAKLDAARALGLPVLMINRPAVPARHELHSLDAVMDWIDHTDTPRGV